MNSIIIKTCPICGSNLDFSQLLLDNTFRYFCRSDFCQLSPYTRYLSPYTRYSIIYKDDTIISCAIVLDIDNIHYRLVNSYENDCFTVIGTLNPFLNQYNGHETDEYVFRKLSKFDNLIPWDDAMSAYNVITRILKIKAFV